MIYPARDTAAEPWQKATMKDGREQVQTVLDFAAKSAHTPLETLRVG